MSKWKIQPVVEGLQQARHEWRERQHRIKEFGGRELPSRESLKSILDDLCGILFPMRLGPSDLRQETEDYYIAYTLDRVLNELFSQVKLALNYEAKSRVKQVPVSSNDHLLYEQQIALAKTIGKLKAVELENILLQQLDDSYWQVRIAVTRSLGLLKAKSAITKLQGNFQHDISNLRKEVAIALGEIGGEQAQNILLQHAEDPDPEVRKSIRIGLALIQEKLNAA